MKALDDLSSKPDRSVLWERDLSLYVWHESSTDLPANTRKQFENGNARNEGGLSYKTKACTPVIQGYVVSVSLRLCHIAKNATDLLQVVNFAGLWQLTCFCFVHY